MKLTFKADLPFQQAAKKSITDLFEGQPIIKQIIAHKPIKVIALDKLFKGNDQLKTNTVLQMRDAGIEFKTV